MTEAKLWYGAWQSRDQAGARKSVAAFLEPIARLAFDSEAADRHAKLRFSLRTHPVDEQRLMIASVAVNHRIELVTHDREFARVAGLALEDWTTPG